MKKRMGLLLLAIVLTTIAFVSGPEPAQASRCLEPDCFASPGCCFDWQCDSWCGGRGFGWCQGADPEFGGCCACVG